MSDQISKAKNSAYIFFFISGASALIYEFIWLRLLGQVFGNTTFAVATVLAAYMAGLGFGSFFVGKWADRWRSPFFAYGLLEIGIGIYAAFTFVFLGVIENVYVKVASATELTSTQFALFRLILAFPVVFIPTFLMGATFPAMLKFFVSHKREVGEKTAIIYGINTAGALTGTLLSGFVLLPVLGLQATLIVAVVINIGIGVLACVMAFDFEKSNEELNFGSYNHVGRVRYKFHTFWLLLGMFISGTTAMVYEVGWTRAFASVLGSSTYAFTIMLATFLSGIAAGSLVYRNMLLTRRAKVSEWGWLQLLIAASTLISLPFIDRVDLLMVRFIAFALDYPQLLYVIKFFVCALFMFLPAFALGALFPVSLSLYNRETRVLGANAGHLYFFNTCGNITGSLLAGFILIPILGIYTTLLLAIILNLTIAMWVLLFPAKPAKRDVLVVSVAVIILISGLWTYRSGWDVHRMTGGLHIRPKPWFLEKDADILATLFMRQQLFYKEGLNSIVSVDQVGDQRQLRVNGKVDASTGGDMVTQLFLGHLPHFLNLNAKKSLIIGFGSGVSLTAALEHPIETAHSVEIEPAVYETAAFFDEVNRKAYEDSRAKLFVNDGRNHLLIQKDLYDVIISEPSNPWMAGIANLFSREFYELVDERLAPNGIFCQWLQTYEISPIDFQMVIATMKSVFKHVTLWKASHGDMLVIGSQDEQIFYLDEIEKRLETNPQIQKDLKPYRIKYAEGLLSYFLLGEKDIEDFIRGARLNTDDQLLLEFNAPKFVYEETDQMILKIFDLYDKEPLPPVITHFKNLSDRPDFLVRMAEGFLGQERYEKAKQYYLQALRFDPASVDAKVGLAEIAYIQDEELFKALQHIEDALMLEPNHARAYYIRGQIFMKINRYNAASRAFGEAVGMDPGQADYFEGLGSAYEKLSEWSKALDAFKTAMELKPQSLKLKMDHLRMLRLAGHWDRAIFTGEALRKRFVTFYPIYKELKTIYETTGLRAKYLKDLEELVEHNPYEVDYWVEIMKTYAQLGRHEDAARAARRIEALKPTVFQVMHFVQPERIPDAASVPL